MAKPDAEYPVLIWALTIRGEMMAVRCTSRAEALEIGRANVASGVWRTWDAFESAGDAEAAEARKIASSSADGGAGSASQTPKSPRPRILADWRPPEAPAPAPVEESPRVPTVKESLKAYRAGKGASQEKPKPTRRRRIIPE